MKELIIDVREADEFCNHHITGALNIPLSSFKQVAPNILSNLPQDLKLALVCGGGRRGQEGLNLVLSLNMYPTEQSRIYPDGMRGWIKDHGLDTISHGENIAVVKYFFLIIAMLTAISLGCAILISPKFNIGIGIAAFFLLFAALKRVFPFYFLIMIAPWNRGKYLKS